MKIVVVGSSNIDMVAQVSHIPAPGETVGNASLFSPLVEKVPIRPLQRQDWAVL